MHGRLSMSDFPPTLLPTRRATREFARALSEHLVAGDLIVLTGPLGSGKTFLARAVCRALGVPRERRVTSPTFALVHEHAGRLPIAHADLYRLDHPGQLEDLGLLALRDDGRVLLVEWGEPYAAALGGDALIVTLELDPRRVRVTGTGPRSDALARATADANALG
ncbi:MAG TPA: tRNA (adenosine(37)-N6)-threonylcarbamoyltransferase complex ATPase subunit type 1 TsaE [Polyangiaceae bacterium]